jgi:hypothetical protein
MEAITFQNLSMCGDGPHGEEHGINMMSRLVHSRVFKTEFLESISRLSILQDHWRENFTNVYNGKIDTWDYQWVYTVLSQNGLAIIPNQNLVVNIGFGEEATHTKDSESVYSAMSASEIINMVHPSFILQNIEADNNYIDNCIGHPDNKYKSIIKKIGKRVKRLVSEV